MKSLLAERDFRFSDAVRRLTLVVDRFGKILVAKKDALRLSGYAKRELAGISVQTLTAEDLRSKHPQHCANFFASPCPPPKAPVFALRGYQNFRAKTTP